MMGRKRLGLIVTTVALAVGSGSFVLPAHAVASEVGGGAFGIRVNVDVTDNGDTNVLVPDQPAIVLPPHGTQYGLTHFNQLGGATALSLTFGAMRVETNGNLYGFPYAESSAFVAKIRMQDSILAESIGTHCIWDVDGARGETTLNGDPTQTPDINTSVPLPGIGEAVFNEQFHELVDGADTIYVNGLHIYLDGRLGQGEIIVAESSCDPNQIPVLGGLVGSPPT